MTLPSKSALITGGSQGFGLEVAKAYVLQNMHVAICGRDTDMLSQAQAELEKLAQGRCKILSLVADISKPDNVFALVTNVIAGQGDIDILVANAGIYGPKGAIDEIDWEAWSSAIDINLKGTVLVCRAVLPYLKQKKQGKIILLSGGGATKPMPNMSAYAASKAAVVRFGETLAEEVKEFHIDVNSVAPGALNTRLLEEILAAGPDKVGKDFYQQSLNQKANGGTPPAKGADLCVYLASDESNGITGRLISAIWDPWSSFAKYKTELENSDIYTLRRIVPSDRNQQWENDK